MEDRRLELRGECLWANGRGADARSFASLCRELAVQCLEHEIRRVLIDATDCDAEGADAVRDAFTVMILAGLAPGFRVAIVANAERMRELLAIVQRDLSQLHVHAALFDEVDAAAQWLSSPLQPSPATDRLSAAGVR